MERLDDLPVAPVVGTTLGDYIDHAKDIIAREKQNRGWFGHVVDAVIGDKLPGKIKAVEDLEVKVSENTQRLQEAQEHADVGAVRKAEYRQLKLEHRLIKHKEGLVKDLRSFFVSRMPGKAASVNNELDQVERQLKMQSRKVVELTYDFSARELVMKLITDAGGGASVSHTASKLSSIALVQALQHNLSPSLKLEHEILALERELAVIDEHLGQYPQQQEVLAGRRLECLSRKILLENDALESINSDLRRARNTDDGGDASSKIIESLEADLDKHFNNLEADLQTIKPMLQEADRKRVEHNLAVLIKNPGVGMLSQAFAAGKIEDQFSRVKALLTDVEQCSLDLDVVVAGVEALDHFLETGRLPDNTAFDVTPEKRQELSERRFAGQVVIVERDTELLEAIGEAREKASESLIEVEVDARAPILEQIRDLNEQAQFIEERRDQDMHTLYGLTEGYYLERGNLKVQQLLEQGFVANDDMGPAEPGPSGPFGSLERLNLQIVECDVQLNALADAASAEPRPSTVKLGQIQDRMILLLDLKIQIGRKAAEEVKKATNPPDADKEPLPPDEITRLKEMRREYKRVMEQDAMVLDKLQANRAVAGAEDIDLMGPPVKSNEAPWKHAKWGRILLRSDEPTSGVISAMKSQAGALLNMDFQGAVDTKVEFLRTTEAQLQVLYAERRRLEAALSPDHVLAPGDRSALETDKARVDGELRNLTAAVTEAKISLHATFLQRIVDKTGDRAYQRNQLVSSLEAKRKQVQEDQGRLFKSEKRAEPVDKSGRPIPMDDAQRVELQARLQENRDNLALHIQEMRTLGNSIDRLDKEIAILDEAYREQIHDYAILRPPERTFVQLATRAASDEALRYLSLGFYSGDKYVSPDEFRTRQKFATAGYCLAAAWDEWGKWQGDNLASMITSQVNDFLVWADRHPKEAAQLATDVVMTINLLQDNDVKTTLLASVNTKIYSSALLGTLESEQKELTIQPSDFKFKALADIARYGPGASAGVRAGEVIAGQLMEGNLLGALTRGAVTFANARYRADVMQRVVDGMNDTTARAASAGLSLMRGDSMQQIVAAQASMNVLALAGSARRAMRSPIPFFGNLIGRMAMPFRQVFAANNWPERILRTGALVLPPVAAVAGVGGVIALAATAALPVLPALLLGVAVVGAALGAFALFAALLNLAWPSTYQRIKHDQAVDVAHSREYRTQLDLQAFNHIKSLKDQRLISVPEERHLDEEPPVIQAWLSAPDSPIPRLQQVMAERLEAECASRLGFKRQIAGTTVGVALDVRDYVKVFNDIVTDEQLNEMVANGSVHIPPLTQEDRDQVMARLRVHVVKRLTNEWLTPTIRQGMEDEFILEFNSYKSAGQFARDQQAKFGAVQAKQNEASAKILSDLDSEGLRQHLALQDVERLRAAASNELLKRTGNPAAVAA